jgi:ribokinase
MDDEKMDLVVVGSANFDYLAQGDNLPAPGQSVQGDEFIESPGGKGTNQAIAAVRLGIQVAFIGRIGLDQRGEWVLDKLKKEGVDTQHIIRDPSVQTGVALIQVAKNGQKQILAIRGANSRLSIHNLKEPTITAGRALLVQLEIPLPVVEAAVRIAHAAGLKVILDPAPAAPLSDDLLSQVDLIKPNSNEAESLTGVRVHDRASARQAAEKLLGRGVQAVMVQAGKEGNLLVWKGGESWNPVLPVKMVDATGAGDAMAAALAVGLIEDKSYEEIGRFANTAAAFATTSLGAQAALPRRQDIERLLHQFKKS